MSCNHKKENNKMEIKTNETERTEAFDGVVVIFIMVVLRVVAGVVVIKVGGSRRTEPIVRSNSLIEQDISCDASSIRVRSGDHLCGTTIAARINLRTILNYRN